MIIRFAEDDAEEAIFLRCMNNEVPGTGDVIIVNERRYIVLRREWRTFPTREPEVLIIVTADLVKKEK